MFSFSSTTSTYSNRTSSTTTAAAAAAAASSLQALSVTSSSASTAATSVTSVSVLNRQMSVTSGTSRRPHPSHHHQLQSNLVSLLNDPDPQARRESQSIYTRTWGEGFNQLPSSVPSLLPDIQLAHFSSYLAKTAERNQRRMHAFAAWQADVQDRIASQAQAASHAPAAGTTDNFNREGMPLLSEIPSLFFEPKLDLSQQKVFDETFNIKSVDQLSAVIPVRQLQEKLSHYLDLVEMQLAKIIARRSDTFFGAMRSQEELFREVHDTVQTISILRNSIRHIDDKLTVQKMQLLVNTRARSRMLEVLEKLKIMATVQQTQPTVQLLLASSDFIGALDLLSTTHEVISTELSGIQSFKHLFIQLQEMEEEIDGLMEQELQKVAMEAATISHGSVSSLRQFESAEAAAPLDVAMNSEERFELAQNRVVPPLLGLFRQRNFQCFAGYREQIQNTLKAVIKDTVANFIETVPMEDSSMEIASSDRDKQTSLTDSIRHLTFRQWLQMLDLLFATLVDLLHGMRAVHQVVVALTDTCTKAFLESAAKSGSGPAAAPPPSSSLPEPFALSYFASHVKVTLSPADQKRFISESEELLRSAMELIQLRCGKILGVRANQTDRLAPRDFVAFSQLIDRFVTECEKIASSPSNSLRSTMAAQAKRFIATFHDQRLSTLNANLENERWRQVDVPSEFQVLATGIVDLAKLSPERRLSFATVSLAHLSRKASVVGKPSLRLLDLGSRPSVDDLFGSESAQPAAAEADVANGGAASIQAAPGKSEATDGVDRSDTQSEQPPAPESILTSPHLSVGTKNFRLPNCALMLIKAISDYCQCATGLPSLTTDIQRRLIEILRLFNKRTWELILGAGALQLAGLKSINAKHLALACQSVDLVLEYLPFIKSILAVNLTIKQQVLLSEVDSVTQDYFQHREQIFIKLVTIMSSVFDKCMPPDFSYEGSETDGGVTVALKTIVRETSKLHKALADVLSPEEIETVFTRVFAMMSKKLCDVFAKCDARSAALKKRAYTDITFYAEELSKLKDVGEGPSNDVQQFVSSKFS